jgi:WD40 repeat protein
MNAMRANPTTLLHQLFFTTFAIVAIQIAMHLDGFASESGQEKREQTTRTEGRLTITKDSAGTTFLAFTPDSGVLAAANEDGKIRFWDVQTGKQLSSTLSHAGRHGAKIAFSRDGKMLASITYEAKGAMRLWDWKNEREIGRLDALVLPTDLAMAPDGKMLAVVDSQHIYLFDLDRKATVHKIPHQDGGLLSWLAVSPDSKKLAVCGLSFRRIRIFDCKRGTEEKIINSDTDKGSFASLYWTKDGQTLIAFGLQNGLSYWDVGFGKRTKHLGSINGESQQSMAVSPDERHLAVGTSDATGAKNLLIWDLNTLKHTKYLESHCPVFSPDGRLLAVASSSTLVIWDFDVIKLAFKER